MDYHVGIVFAEVKALFAILNDLIEEDMILQIGLTIAVVVAATVFLATTKPMSSRSRLLNEASQPIITKLSQVWLVGLLSSSFLLIVQGYRLYTSSGADRMSQIVWIQRLSSQDFAPGDLLLEKGDSLRLGFSLLVWSFSKLLGIEGAYFLLSFSFSVIMFVASAFLYLSFSQRDFTSATVFAFLMTFFTWGRFGYAIAVHSGNYQWDLIPRVVSVPLALVAIGLYNLENRKAQFAALFVGTVGVWIQPVSAIVAIGTYLTARILFSWFSRLSAQETNKNKVNLCATQLARLFTWLVILSNLAVVLIFTASETGLVGWQARIGISIFWLIAVLGFLSATVFVAPLRSGRNQNTTNDFGHLVLFSLLALGILILGFLGRAAEGHGERNFSFLETLEIYDLVLGFRSPRYAELWGTSPLSITWVSAFLLILGWLYRSRVQEHSPKSLTVFLWLISYFVLVLLSSLIVALPGVGGGNVLWPLSSSFIIIVTGVLIIMGETLIADQRQYFFTILGAGLLVSQVPESVFGRLNEITVAGLILITLMGSALLSRRVRS